MIPRDLSPRLALRVLQRRAKDVTKLLMPFEPTDVVAELAAHKAANRDFNVTNVHVHGEFLWHGVPVVFHSPTPTPSASTDNQSVKGFQKVFGDPANALMADKNQMSR